MNQIRFYNIHNIVKFKINDKQNLIFKDLIGDPFEEYINYLSRGFEEDQLDFIVNIQNNIEKRKNCFILDDKYYIDQNYIYITDSYKIAKWTIEIIKDKQKYILNIKANRTARLFISGFFIDFIIQYILTQKGYSIIHSSGVSKNGISYLFSGRGGSGKTSTAIYIISSNDSFQFLGDDFIIIKNNLTLPYITPLNLFKYNINSFLSDKFNIKQKIMFSLKSIVFKFSFGYAKFFTKLNPMQYFPERISSISEFSDIFIILPINKQNKANVYKIQLKRDEVIHYLVNNMKMDSWYIPKYFIQYGFLFPNHEFSTYWEDYEKNLVQNLSESKKFYKVILPRSSTWQKLIKTLFGDERYE